jgi:hypothetical protein
MAQITIKVNDISLEVDAFCDTCGKKLGSLDACVKDLIAIRVIPCKHCKEEALKHPF